MIQIIQELPNGMVEVESDCGKYIDGGGIPQKKAVIKLDDIQYVREVDESEAELCISQMNLFHEEVI